ncbi:reverse transcriptase [Cucumis melo var. makuwa]|uniref:Reverse transcriptase n=1 Tax=Cucumis melo var. makuwa TaxID=1194695 RepID=A0A5A7UK35_CUCMM|nr:reverse transcriptase [Cucumis melo var. makuwa]TYK27570.1 reverse transcriptase [Cucumis melo var. makuwa]
MSENDRFETNSTDSHIDNKAGENDGFETAVPEDMGEHGSVDGVIIDREDKIDENEESLDFTTIPKSIHLALECPEWKAVVMEEMRALEKNKTWDLCTLPKGDKLSDANGGLYLSTEQTNAFLNEDLKKEVYMSPPLGFVAQFNNQVYNQWHFDHTLFTKVSKIGKIAVLVVYIDDIVLSHPLMRSFN